VFIRGSNHLEKQAQNSTVWDNIGVVLEQFGVSVDNIGVFLDNLGSTKTLKNRVFSIINHEDTKYPRLTPSITPPVYPWP
jgi:hypothetical protein